VLNREGAVLLEHRVLVEELRHVTADDEEVKQLVVDFGEFRDRLAGQRMANGNAEPRLLSGLDRAWFGGNAERIVRGRHRIAGHQRHPADAARARRGLHLVRMHRANESAGACRQVFDQGARRAGHHLLARHARRQHDD
jgi:hypothetical protein